MKKLFVLALAAFAGLSLQAQTFGRVNFSELVALMPEMDQAREVIAASQKEAEETYSAMLEEFQSKYSQYQQKQATWTAAIKESKERELSDMHKAVQELAKAKGLTALFDATQALYFDESKVIDLTPEARKALGIAEGRTLESLQAELQEKAQAAQQQAQ